MNPKDLVRSRVRDLTAYHVEPRPCDAALDANESPYPPPESVRARAVESAGALPLNRYPDPQSKALREALASKEGVREEEILLGNGSDEIIQMLIASVCDPGERIMTFAPTFSMYRLIAHYLNADTIEVPLKDDWSVDLGMALNNIKAGVPKIIFIASPNNPTGSVVGREEIVAIADAAPGIVVVDEAYADFAEERAGLVFRERENVVILRTLSKTGLAAIRLGYMMADRRLVEQVDKTRLPFNINSITQAIAAEAARRWDEMKPVFDLIIRERGRVFSEVSVVDGVTPFPSEANFILMRIDDKDPREVFESLLDNGVRARWFKDDPRLGDCFRVTVGKPEENDRFIAALRKAL